MEPHSKEKGSLFHRGWPTAVLILGLTVTLAWAGLLVFAIIEGFKWIF